MLLSVLLAAAAAAPPSLPVAEARADARVSVRIVVPGRVVRGQSSEPHTTAKLTVVEPDGGRTRLNLVEFP